MKTFIKLTLFVVIALLSTGIYLKSTSHINGEFITGIGVLVLAFILIPMFVYHRYRGKDLTKYSFKNMQSPEEKNEKKS